jgi:phage-related minor tail protein
MGSQYAARLGVLLAIDTAEFTAGVNEAVATNKKLKRAIESDMQAAAKEIQRLQYAVQDYGKEVTHVTQMERALAEGGRFARLAKIKDSEAIVQGMLAQAAALDKLAAADKKLGAGGQTSGMDRYLKQALAYQTTDIVTSLAGGQNPLMVLLQQGGQLKDQFGGFKPLFAGIAEAVTLSKVAFAGAAAAVAALAYGFYQGSKEAAKFRDDLILTNNYAGVTTQSFDKLSSALSDKLNVSITDTKSIFSALVSSGKVTRENLDGVAEVIANIARLSGESAEAVANSLIPSMDGSASSAMKLNERYHFLNLAQYKHIEALNKQGKASEALKYQNDLLNKSFEDQERNLGLVESAWNKFLMTVGNVKDALFSIGKEAGDSQLLDAAVSKLRTASTVYGMAPSADRKKEMDAALAEYQKLQDDIANKNKKATDHSNAEALKQQQIKAYNEAGGLEKSLSIQADIRKQSIDKAYQDSLFNATEMEKVQIESAKRIAEKTLEIEQQNATEKYTQSSLRYKQLAEFVLMEESKAAQEKQKINREEYKAVQERQISEKDALDMEKQKMGVYQDNIFMTETEAKIAEKRLETAQKIAKIMRDEKLTDTAKEALVAEQEAIGKTGEEIILLGEKLQYIKDVNAAVFQSMTQAIQAFLITGKFNFKNFALSVVASLLQIQAQMMAMAAMRGMGSIFGSVFGSMSSTAIAGGASPGGAFTGSGNFGIVSGGSYGTAADGGFINAPTLVGENGPELFIPSGAGTIIPNQQMNDYGSGQAQNVFNGPYIANMSAIDTQSGMQFLAKNKMTIWSLNQSANRSVPAGR